MAAGSSNQPGRKALAQGLQGMPAGTPCRPTLHHAGHHAGHLLLKGPMWARTPSRPGSASFPSSSGRFLRDSARAVVCLPQSQKSHPCLQVIMAMPDEKYAAPLPCVVATAMLGVSSCPSTAIFQQGCEGTVALRQRRWCGREHKHGPRHAGTRRPGDGMVATTPPTLEPCRE